MLTPPPSLPSALPHPIGPLLPPPSLSHHSLPLPEPKHPPSLGDEQAEQSNKGDKKTKARRVRVFMEDRNTLVLVFKSAQKFYVLERASSVPHDHEEGHQSTPLYALLTTNILGWVVTNMLATMGNDLSHLSHMFN